jgi:hypothetical protein
MSTQEDGTSSLTWHRRRFEVEKRKEERREEKECRICNRIEVTEGTCDCVEGEAPSSGSLADRHGGG